jgi:hypothetical protein
MKVSAIRMLGSALALSMMALLWRAPALAQGAATGSVSGTVRTTGGVAVGGASVAIRGIVSQATTTDAHGAYRFTSVPPGVYQLIVTKAGFFQSIGAVTVATGAAVTVDVALLAQSFTSLKTIAHVSTAGPGIAPINQSTAAINTISAQQFQDQGQTQVMKVLNETPGIIAWAAPGANNGADEDSPQVIQIRGALPYETESLIDGHPTTLGLTGTFDPHFLNPALLQDVEIVKGPGSMPTEINYAIGGTVNFITLEPTRRPEAMASIGADNWGGINTAFRITGSTPSNFLQYAFGYATDGAPGPMQNYQLPGSALFLVAGQNFTWKVNGQYIAQVPEGATLAGPVSYYRYAGETGYARFAEPVYVCCWGFNTDYDAKNELGKLRFNFGQTTSLTLSYLGGQNFGHTDNVGEAASYAPVGDLANSSFSSFAPPPGYTGSVPAGTPIPFDLSAFLPGFGNNEQSLYQAEFRTTFGQWTALARYFDADAIDYAYLDVPPTRFVFGGKTWGGLAVCPPGQNWNPANPSFPNCSGGSAPTTEFFNGQQATFSVANATNQSLTDSHERGESLQFSRAFGNGSDLELSADRSINGSTLFINIPTSGLPPYYSTPPGSSQQFLTESVRFGIFAAPQVYVKLADYAIQYSSHFSSNGGGLAPPVPGGTIPPAIWGNATRAYDAPRLALTWQPNADTSFRFATGWSIAPPFLSLLNGFPAPGEIINGIPTSGFDENLNNGNIAPETAFGSDIGVDKRFHESMFVSFDAYLENLRNMYLPSTFLINQDFAGTSSQPCPAIGLCPLYATETQNLGHARYEGVELSMGDIPISGLGFRLNFNMMRAYAYDLPPGFYCTTVPANKCTPYYYDTNLGILPNINFEATGIGANSLNAAAVPYSMGYGELNWRTIEGAYYEVGATYYGSNNSYSWPAFFVVSAGIREPLGSHLFVQLSGDNLTGAHDQLWTDQLGGIAAPLAPECVGKYGSPLATAEGASCSGLADLLGLKADTVVIPQTIPVNGMNYGPTSFRLQLIDYIGGGNP